MTADPKISVSIKDCKSIQVNDTTVNTLNEFYGRVIFITDEDEDNVQASYVCMTSLICLIPLLRDGTHIVNLVCVDEWEAGTYAAGDIVLKPAAGEMKSSPYPMNYYLALSSTNEEPSDTATYWQRIIRDADAYSSFMEAGNVKIASLTEIVDCKVFESTRTECNVFEISKTDDVEYNLEIYTLKGFNSGETPLSVSGEWSANKMKIDFSDLFSEPTNIYVVKLINPNSAIDINYKVINNLCMVHECMKSLILDILCKECNDCYPSKEELFKRHTLNRMVAVYSSLMMNLQAAELQFLGTGDLTESAYNTYYAAAGKLENLVMLMTDCGECKAVFENCSSC